MNAKKKTKLKINIGSKYSSRYTINKVCAAQNEKLKNKAENEVHTIYTQHSRL